MKHRSVLLQNRSVEVQWEETEGTVQATVDGRSYALEFRRLDSQTLWVYWNAESIEACVIRKNGQCEVSIRGRRVVVEFQDTAHRGRRAGNTSGDSTADILAPMPGKVVRVLVKKDDVVEARQGIAIMEAMKMQNEIRSPRSGRILAIDVSEGDAVNGGDLIGRVGDYV